jgi:hypothetical protein
MRNESSRLLRLGMTKTVKLNQSNKSMRYQFMLDDKAPVVLAPTLISGKVNISLSFEDSDYIFAFTDTA